MPIGIEMIIACAPNVAPETTQQIIHVESRGNTLAINVNRGRLERQPRDAADAAELARKYIARGYTVDLGLMQINSTNISRLGYRIEDMFDPCKNIAAGARVLTEFYANARRSHGDEQAALRAALSAYNTGSFVRGITNGYVARYETGAVAIAPAPRVPALNPYTVQTAVFIRQMEEQAMIRTNTPTPHTQEQVTPVVSRRADDADTPGVQIEHTAEEADRRGAFVETAVSEREAWQSNDDLNQTAIVVGGQRVLRGAN